MIRLLENKVAVTPIDDPERTASGRIIIPDMAKERSDQGIVKYIGPDVVDIKIGMYVVFSGYAGSLMHFQSEGRLIIMPEPFFEAIIPEVENMDVPGLYFRGPISNALQYQELYDAIAEILPELAPEMIGALAVRLGQKGMTGPLSNPYFQANYEHSMEYMAKAVQESNWFSNIRIKASRPRLEEYDQTRASK